MRGAGESHGPGIPVTEQVRDPRQEATGIQASHGGTQNGQLQGTAIWCE